MQKLSAEDTLSAYKRINSGYRRKAVFQLNSGVGFGSNINRMITMMLYCLVYKFQFQLGSSFWLSGEVQGNEGMFVPFSPESNFQPPHITRPRQINEREYALRWKKRHPFVLNLNFALRCDARDVPNMSGNPWKFLEWLVMFLWLFWRRIRRKMFFNHHHFFFPELGIDGDIFHAKSIITKMIFRPGAKVADEHRAAMENLKPYIAVYVRKGDKLKVGEAKEIKVPEYLAKILSLAPEIGNIFVATDDYRVVSEFRKLRPSLNVVTFCDKKRKGYFQKEFKRSLASIKEKAWVEFCTDLYYLENADHFVGTYSSNISRLAALLRGGGGGGSRSYSLDEKWHPN